MEPIAMTTQEVADKMGVPKETAYLLLQYMEKTHLITRAAENRKSPGAKGNGKGQVVYLIHAQVGERVKEDLANIFKVAPAP